MQKYFSWGLLFTGILLLFSGAVIGSSVIEKLCDRYGSYSYDKVVISLTREAYEDKNNLFTQEDIKKLSLQPGTGKLAASARSIKPVQYGDIRVEAGIHGVSYSYFDFMALNFIKGNFISKSHEEEASRVAVIDEKLALELFGTSNIIGKELKIYGEKFKVIGVFESDTSILGIITEHQEPSVYIPVGVMLEMDQSAGISSIQVKTSENDLLGRNEDMVFRALRAIGKDTSGYRIEDYHISVYYLQQKIHLLIFIPGLLIILLMIKLLKNTIKELVIEIWSKCKTDYLLNVVKICRVKIVESLIRTGLMFAAMAAIWSNISFKLFIPPNYIPDELIDLSYYLDLLKDGILQNNSRLGYFPPAEEFLLTSSQSMLNVLFYSALLAGLPMLVSGLYQLRLRDTSLYLLIPAVCIITVMCLFFISITTVFGLEMPLNLDTKGLLILFAFVFIHSILFSKEREEVL